MVVNKCSGLLVILTTILALHGDPAMAQKWYSRVGDISIGGGGGEEDGPTYDYDPDENGNPCGGAICLDIPVDIYILDGCGEPDLCPPGGVKVQAILYDCDDNIIDSDLKSVDAPESCVPGEEVGRDEYVTFHFSVCNGIPRRVEVRSFDAIGRPGTTCSEDWVPTPGEDPEDYDDPDIPNVPFVEELPLPTFDCSLTKSQLDCLVCDAHHQPLRGAVSLYKNERTLYSLPPDDRSQAQHAETINGKFDIPEEGVLYVRVLGSTGVADVYGGQDGWQHSPAPGTDGRHGESTGGAVCYEATGPGLDDWQFNIRTYKGLAPDFRLEFTWYRWLTNAAGETCCVLSQEEVLRLPVQPLPCLPDAVEPSLPAIRKWPGPHQHLEMRLPCCGGCESGGGACTGPGMTDWFIVWPSEIDGVIRYGPARGWRVDAANDALWSPGPDTLKHQFSANHND